MELRNCVSGSAFMQMRDYEKGAQRWKGGKRGRKKKEMRGREK